MQTLHYQIIMYAKQVKHFPDLCGKTTYMCYSGSKLSKCCIYCAEETNEPSVEKVLTYSVYSEQRWYSLHRL